MNLSKQDRRELTRLALDFLNQVYEDDPGAVNALVRNRVPCNVEIKHQGSIVVSSRPHPFINGGELREIGPLELMSGMLRAMGLEIVVEASQQMVGSPKFQIPYGSVQNPRESEE
jgi:hypothetical protein